MHVRLIPSIAGAVIVVSQLSNFVFAPALPEISRHFTIAPGTAQLLMTVFLAGYAAVQIVVGPLADSLGRRPVLIAGVLLLALGCAVSGLAPTMALLFAGIILQSLGAGILPTIGQAMIRDSQTQQRTMTILTRLGMALALASAVTPMIGTTLVGGLGWRGLFLAMAVAALALLPFSWISPETLSAPQLAAARASSPMEIALSGYRAALGQRRLVLYAIMIGCLTGAMTVFFTGAPFLFIHTLKVSVHAYGLWAFAAFLPFIAGAMAVPVLLKRKWLSLEDNILLGCGLAVAGTGFGWFASDWDPTPVLVLIGAGLFTFGLGIAVVLGKPAALLGITDRIAASTALITFLMTVLAAAISAVAGVVEAVAHVAIFGIMFASTAVAFAAALAAGRPARQAVAA
ncbi:multidrug effflux MFS transporter [Phreatobacter aquaticus]|uniref:Multidrug effflux MFS transporter n=1 Tax=Phreatobacter aquaticus TaxID=2570229 RepID=A0A4D7QLS7_9HYPH|nr:MFS transporter [Phreatobacter aquaticus]QCK88548.1 multidrug effflux MFS transporter [Phreatobacter aquaticus]